MKFDTPISLFRVHALEILRINQTLVESVLRRNLIDFDHMLIDVVRPENWEELNDEVKSSLNLPAKSRARVYHGMAQAVFEISQGTAQFMSHKKAVAFVLGQSPLVESLLPYYYKETYEVQTLSQEELTDPKAWVEGLKKDTNFVLYSEDHPVTGERYAFAEELDKVLNEKRIFSFRMSHGAHYFSNEEVRPYTVHFRAYGTDVSVAVCGERFRTPSLMAHSMAWTAKDILTEMQEQRTHRLSDEAAVRDFEKAVASSARPYFSDAQLRTWDRAAIVFPDVSADALAQEVFKKMGLQSETGWHHMATTNMCTWDVVRMFHPWWKPAPSLEDLRGLLLINAHFLKTPQLVDHLVSSYQELKAQQHWTVE